LSAVAGDGVQRQINGVAAKAAIDPSHGLTFPKVVAEGGKIDQLLSFADIPSVGMAIEDGFYLEMGVEDFEQAD
jgi:hypothetical protein